jgi:hypothetical protein
MEIFKYYISENFNLSKAIEKYQSEVDAKFSLKIFNELLKKKEYAEKWLECKQLEIDEIKAAQRLLCLGIPIKNDQGEILGWQEKPDLKAIEDYSYQLKKS